MLRKYIKLSDILIIAFLCAVSYPCFGQNYYTSSVDFPQAQFRSTSAMPTTYTVPQLNSYGTATSPSYSPYRSGSMRRSVCPSCGCSDGCNCGCCSDPNHLDSGGGSGTAEQCDCPAGDIDLITILLMLGLGLTIKHTRNKQNSI